MSKLRDPITFQTAFGAYRAIEIVGEGGAGVVYGGFDDDGGHVAIKALRQVASSQHRKRFQNEIEFLRRVTHPNLVQVLDAGVREHEGKPLPFFVMPRLDCSLEDLLREPHAPERRLAMFLQLLDGVEAAHLKGVVHRDLKPRNVLVRRAPLQLVVADFGVASVCEELMITPVETAPGERLANFAYAAPEQRRPGIPVDHRADIFALGLILNEMFTRELAVGSGYKRVSDAAKEYEFLDPIVESMLAQSPERRPATIEEVKKLIERARGELVVRQRLSAIDLQVVRADTIDDPLALEPIRVVGADWDKNVLRLKLSRSVNKRWREALRRSAGGWAMGSGPDDMEFEGTSARVHCYDNYAQRVIDNFKAWLDPTMRAYREILESEARERAEESRQRLATEREEAERKSRVNRGLRF